MADAVSQDQTPPPGPQDILPQQARTAMQSPQQLINWLAATNRTFLVFDAAEMVRAQVWPEGVEALIALIAAYRDHRGAMPSGETEEVDGPAGKVTVPRMKGERLELDELDQCIRWMVAEMRERNPGWHLAPVGTP